MDKVTAGKNLIENISQEWTDDDLLSFLLNYPAMLRESFCFRTMMGYRLNALGGDEINMIYIGDNPQESLLIAIGKSNSKKSLISNPLVPFISYTIVITTFDFPATFLSLKPAILKEQEGIKERTRRAISEHEALAIVFRKGTGLLGAKKYLLEASYGKKSYWLIIQNLISLFKKSSPEIQRQEQIFPLLEKLNEDLNERMYDQALNSMQNLKFFAR